MKHSKGRVEVPAQMLTERTILAMADEIRRRDREYQRDAEQTDPFLAYVRKNSMVSATTKYTNNNARRIGRRRPSYCELHEYWLLEARDKRPPVADHNHENGKYRGWVCSICNMHLIPEVDRLRSDGNSAEEIKTFLNLIVDYVFSDGEVLDKIFSKNFGAER